MKAMELGVCSTFFLEQIHGGAAGVGCVWRRKFGVELFFLDLELRGALPNTLKNLKKKNPVTAYSSTLNGRVCTSADTTRLADRSTSAASAVMPHGHL
jgi:hypothetical protein